MTVSELASGAGQYPKSPGVYPVPTEFISRNGRVYAAQFIAD
jgi:hypothetical protein